MSNLSQFFSGTASVPVHGLAYVGGANGPGIQTSGAQVFAKTGTQTMGAATSTVSKVQGGASPGYALPFAGMSSGYGGGETIGTNVVYNNGIWLRTSATGIYRSTDAVSWTPIIYINDTSATYTIATKVIVINNAFVFVAKSPSLALARIYYSTDGITWAYTYVETGAIVTLFFSASVANGTAFIVISGTSGSQQPIIITSTDGVTWKPNSTATTFTTNIRYNEVVFGGGRYLISSPDAASMMGSTDGITWVTQSGPLNVYILRYLNSLWVSGGTSGAISTSANGTSWTTQTSNLGTADVTKLEYAFGVYVAATSTGTIASSPTGVTWTARTSNVGGQVFTGLIVFNSLFVGLTAASAASVVTTSPDGITWTARSLQFTSNNTQITSVGQNTVLATDGTTLVALTGQSAQYNDQVSSSTNGTTWAQLLSTGATVPSNNETGIFLVNGKLFHLPATGGIQTADPANHAWKMTLNLPATTFTGGVAFGNSVYVAAGSGGVIYSSADGITWTVRTSGTATGFSAMVYAGGLFVGIGNNMCRTSTDGITWTTRAAAFPGQPLLVYANNTWVAYSTSAGTQFYVSSDAITWTLSNTTLPYTYFYMKVLNDIVFFLRNTVNTAYFTTFDGNKIQTVGPGTAAVSTQDCVESNGIYYVSTSDGSIVSASGKSAALGIAGSAGWSTQAITSLSSGGTALPAIPGIYYVAQSTLISSFAKGPNNELFGCTSQSLTTASEGGSFYYTGTSMPIYNTAVSSNNVRNVVGTNYAYIPTSQGYVFLDRSTLTSGMIAVSDGATRAGVSPQLGTASTIYYKRIA